MENDRFAWEGGNDLIGIEALNALEFLTKVSKVILKVEAIIFYKI